jgi:hypothetical protein
MAAVAISKTLMGLKHVKFPHRFISTENGWNTLTTRKKLSLGMVRYMRYHERVF